MKEKLHDITITFDDVASATISGLTDEQSARLSAILKLSGGWYRWNGQLVEQPPSIRARLGALWRHFNAWMMGGCVIVALLLSAPVFAQDFGPRAIEPIRVSIVATPGASATDEEFNRRLRAELNKSKTVAFTSQSDYDIATAATEITERGRVVGYAVATMVVAPEGSRRRRFNLSIKIGPSLEELAADLARKLDAEYFKSRQ